MISKCFCSILLFSISYGLCAEQKEATGNHINAIAQYNLAIKVIPETHHLEVKGEIILPPASETRNSLDIYLSGAMHDFEAAILEPKALAGKAKLEQKRTDGDTIIWSLQPPESFPAGDAVHLKFSYTGGKEKRHMFYIGKEGSFASFGIYWYPKVYGYLRCTAKMHFSVPAGYTAVAPGKRISLLEQEKSGNFAFSMTQPMFLSFAVGKYFMERRTDAQGNAISAYLLKPKARIGEYLDQCLKVLDALTQEFGPNPLGEFVIVETPRNKSSFWGASDDGIIMGIDRFFQGDFNTAFWGHEIAHQWWGCSIRYKEMRGGNMLVEGMGQYGSLRAVEMLEGPDMAERYRRTGYPGYAHEQNAAGYFKMEAKGLDRPLDTFHPNAIRLAHAKGFIVFDMLSRTVGRDIFRLILQDIARNHAAGEMSWDEFLDEIEKGSGMNLRWFYEQWFERKGAPRWEVSWRQEGDSVRGTILQQQPYFRADVEVLIKGDHGRELLRTVELRSEKTEFSFPSDFKALTLTVDPHFLVLHYAP
jgi:hypothetical protein